MNTNSSLKPEWLIDVQGWLRAHPVRRAAIWAVLSCALVLTMEASIGTTITPRLVEVAVLGFAIGGVFFYGIMRWWEARGAR